MLKRIAVLISGGGTNLQAVIDACESKRVPGQVVGVISNKADAYGLKRADNHLISSHVISRSNYPDKKERTKALIKSLESMKPDLIVLAGFLEILQPEFIRAFSDKIINIHPSLIPKYAGKGYYGMKVHEAVIKAGEAFSGATVHFVDEHVDTGQIIIQESLRVASDETPESLQKRVLNIEHKILIESINKCLRSEV
ncbi:phosphoribosylglycinamide formyltransferase [Acidaminobacter sp. JC074]|uniref:phosphoribosylglycinamide formyltransferase n=1 Tax=Acidaminobacter sp. JC074 TaxID=2530199 RepID=UPI001F0D16F3|nr:phosphoribosylglycinamide formyltransferase [Acidaminobacter sp. JC074]MCH4889923.1 phosphoribosylglycinamide formyltransferase [Acidaminobacter sp. JC074]